MGVGGVGVFEDGGREKANYFMRMEGINHQNKLLQVRVGTRALCLSEEDMH